MARLMTRARTDKLMREKVDLEAIRAEADAAAEAGGVEEELEFFAAAKRLGYTTIEAEWADEVLTMRVMRARGAL